MKKCTSFFFFLNHIYFIRVKASLVLLHHCTVLGSFLSEAIAPLSQSTHIHSYELAVCSKTVLWHYTTIFCTWATCSVSLMINPGWQTPNCYKCSTLLACCYYAYQSHMRRKDQTQRKLFLWLQTSLVSIDSWSFVIFKEKEKIYKRDKKLYASIRFHCHMKSLW